MRMRTVCVLSVALLCTGALLARPVPQTGKSDLAAKAAPVVKTVKEAPRAMEPANPARLSPKAVHPAPVAQFDQAASSRQGGDTCDSAFAIPSLPFSDNGTTVDFANDYDEACPYTGSLSGDVVYSFVPAQDGAIQVSLCVGATDYDSKLYIYQDACAGGTAIACNDDACSSPAFANYVSKLDNIAVTTGHTYYIVIDGYGSAMGTYYIDMDWFTPPPPPDACPEGSLFAQTVDAPEAAWNAFTSAQTSAFSYTVYEDFGVTGPICDIHWWGLSLFYSGGFTPCDGTGMTFTIQFYQDAGGMPGTPVCSYTVTPIMTDVGLSYAGFPLFRFDVPALVPCCNLQEGWVSIQSLPNANDCAFLWMSAGAGQCWQQDNSTGAFTTQAYNLSLCLTGVYVPTFGACCNDQTGTCEDNVELINCLPPSRFAANTLCADLTPACGQIPGACCHPDGTCEVVVESACADNWLGPNTVCSACPCIVTCPPGSIPEPELCGEDLDGGCNFPPSYPFAPIAPGDTVCGTYYTSTATRDTDWYSFTTTQSYIYTWTVRGTIPTLVFIIDGNTGCPATVVIASLSGPECTDVTVTSPCLGPGTYWFWAGSSVFEDLPCEQTYVATLTATECFIPLGACCLSSGECIPDLSSDTCVAQGGIWQGEGTTCDPNPCPLCTPDFVVEAPGEWTGNTCGALSNCPLRPSEDHIYQVTIPEDGIWHFDTCGAEWDTYIFVGTSCCGSEIGLNDDGCSATPYSFDSNLVVTIPAGIYYVTIEGYSADGCGDYPLHIFKEADCIIECPPGGVLENEPDCYENYVDVTNGGCNSVPPVFSPLACGETVCGTSGNYLFNGSSYRDTDWYEVVITQPTTFTFTVNAEFTCAVGLIEQIVPGLPGCENITGSINPFVTTEHCIPAVATVVGMPAGTYYFFVSLNASGVPCGSNYTATLTCEVPPVGACCLSNGDCGDGTTEPECLAMNGVWQGQDVLCENIVCEPFYCPAGSNVCDEYIGNVIIEDPPFSNPTDCTPGGYADYTNLCIAMEIGTSYNITIENPVPYSSDQCGIWIDWNQNYTFEPEEAQLVSGSPGGGPYTATILVPEGALDGNTRMRIRVTYTGVVDPCGTTTYGEVEDYCITVSGGVCGDFNNDHLVNADDYFAFLDAFGTCVGDIKYLPAADFDGDTCITLVDYQAWLACYHDANGVNFVPPSPRKPAVQHRPMGRGSLSR